MRKCFAILMTVCLLCAAGMAAADMEAPTWESMPAVVLEDENTTVDVAAFEGEWVLNAAFANTEYVYEQTLAGTYDYNFMPFCITGTMVTQDVQNENGEFVTVEMPCVFESGQLQGVDGNGREFTVELLEDGSIVMSVFFPGEDDTVTCLSVFLVHPAE